MDVVAHYSKTRCRATVAVLNKSLSVMEILTESNGIAMSIDLDPGVLVIVVSVYLPPLDEVDAELDLLKDLFDRSKGKCFAIVGDFNAKSTLWGNPLHVSVDCGDQVVELCIENELLILNDPLSEETFRMAPMAVAGSTLLWVDL